MKLRTTLAAAPAAALLALATCAEPKTPTGTTAPPPDLGDPSTSGNLADQRDSCTFHWEYLPFEDDSIEKFPISHYDAIVWQIPHNVFSNDSSLQAVDLTVPPNGYQYLDVEDDVIRWHCDPEGDEEDSVSRVSVRPLDTLEWPLPEWARHSNGSSRFEVRDWPDYPYKGDPVVAFEEGSWRIEAGDSAVLLLELFGGAPGEVLGEAKLVVKAYGTAPKKLPRRPCTFVRREPFQKIDELNGGSYHNKYRGVGL